MVAFTISCPDRTYFTQSDGQIMESTLRTYVVHFRYVVRYLADVNRRPLSSLPMAAYLSRWGRHYQRGITRMHSERSWQVLDRRNQWIHWWVTVLRTTY